MANRITSPQTFTSRISDKRHPVQPCCSATVVWRRRSERITEGLGRVSEHLCSPARVHSLSKHAGDIIWTDPALGIVVHSLMVKPHCAPNAFSSSQWPKQFLSSQTISLCSLTMSAGECDQQCNNGDASAYTTRSEKQEVKSAFFLVFPAKRERDQHQTLTGHFLYISQVIIHTLPNCNDCARPAAKLTRANNHHFRGLSN